MGLTLKLFEASSGISEGDGFWKYLGEVEYADHQFVDGKDRNDNPRKILEFKLVPVPGRHVHSMHKQKVDLSVKSSKLKKPSSLARASNEKMRKALLGAGRFQ